MTQTKYPISKIRSGEVAVKLTSLEQFKKIAPEQDNEQEAFSPNFYHVYERKQKYVPELELYWITKRECNLYTLIDFSQIDWEEVKEETVEEAIKREYEARKFNSDFPFEPQSFKIGAKWQKEQLDKELSSLKAENERLKRDMGDITRKNVELVLENETLSSKNATLAANYFESYQQLQQQQTSQSQELSLRQRMAWELYVSGFNHGIADKWTIAECYRSANIFLNYKGGDDGQ
jgi:regulator of replication initiation timing